MIGCCVISKASLYASSAKPGFSLAAFVYITGVNLPSGAVRSRVTVSR